MYVLYHYVHCPFCIRVRMALGHLQLPYESTVLPYDDEKTPQGLIGAKMLPIVKMPDGTHMGESLDIIAKLDKNDQLATQATLGGDLPALNELLARMATPTHGLAIPYWMYTPEFDSAAQKYYRAKKEKSKGPFHLLVQNRKALTQEVHRALEELAPRTTPLLRGERLTLRDILIAAHLWGLYIVPEFQFPLEIHNYLQSVAKICHFNYHEDFWSSHGKD